MPRVLAKTQTIVRSIIELSDGFVVSEGEEEANLRAVETPERRAGRDRRNAVNQLVPRGAPNLKTLLNLSTQEGGPEDFLDKRLWDFIISLPR